MSNKKRLYKRTERLLSIAMKMQGRKKVSARTLAEEFQVSERTIYRDLGILSGAGIPYEYSRDYGYRILPGYYLPPLMFTTQQAAALLMGAEFIKLRSDASINREANEAADKIRAVLPETVLQHIDELIDRTSLDPYWLHQVPTNEYFSKLSDAIVQRRTVWIEYFVGSRKEVTRRQVDPLGLVFYTDHWNLVAPHRTQPEPEKSLSHQRQHKTPCRHPLKQTPQYHLLQNLLFHHF